MTQAELEKVGAEEVRRAYRRWAPVYDYTFGLITVAGRRQAVRHINGGSGRVLEVGVGTGISLGQYRRHLEVVGIDLSHEMLAKARDRVAREKLEHVTDVVEMDAAQLAFPDASFDVVVAMYVLTTVPDPDQVMAELERVCRPGGEVVLLNHFSADGGPRAAIERMLARHASRLGWRPEFPISIALSRPGLDLVEQRPLAPFGIFTMLRLHRKMPPDTEA